MVTGSYLLMDKTTQHRVIHWGKPSSNYREWTTTTVCCHGYANLPTERGTSSKSPEFACLGHRWYLELYPGGDEDSANDYAAIFLWSNEPPGEGGGGSSRMYIDFAFAVRDDGGGGTGGGGVVENLLHGSNDGNLDIGLGGDFASKSRIMDALVDGTLVIEVRMRRTRSSSAGATYAASFVPANPSSTILSGLFLDESTSDIAFRVMEGTTPAVEFHAHKLILERYANKLSDLCRSSSGGGGGDDAHAESSMVLIDDVSPNVFRHLLHYMYGGRVFEDGDAGSRAREVYDAADAYGVTELKLEAEAYYVDSAVVSVDNVVELLTFADAKNCALLKERVMDYIVANEVEVLERLSLEDVPGVHFSDLLAAVARADGRTTSRRREGGEGEESLSVMGIGELRRMAHERGLSIDGSRESLVSALRAPPGGATAPVAVSDSGGEGGGGGGKGGFLMRFLAPNAISTTTGGSSDVPRDYDAPSSASDTNPSRPLREP